MTTTITLSDGTRWSTSESLTRTAARMQGQGWVVTRRARMHITLNRGGVIAVVRAELQRRNAFFYE